MKQATDNWVSRSAVSIVNIVKEQLSIDVGFIFFAPLPSLLSVMFTCLKIVFYSSLV